jgi:hypothetical protein
MTTTRAEVTTMKKSLEEIRIAEQIVSVLPAGVARACSNDHGSIRYSVRGDGMKLKMIVLRRASLHKLAGDPARDVKIEYLRRDLLESATRRSEFRYPRIKHVLARPTGKRFRLGLPLTAAL